MAGNTFWGNQSAIAEPKRAYAWVLESTRFGPTWICKSAKKPQFEVTEIKTEYVNHEFYYPGRVKWKEIEIVLVDIIDPDSAASCMNILMLSGYKYPTSEQNAQMALTKQNAVNAFGGGIVLKSFNETLNVNSPAYQEFKSDLSSAGVTGGSSGQPVGVIEEWHLVNPWVKSIDFGELKYDSDAVIDIKLQVRYDWARLHTASPGHKGFKAKDIGSPGNHNG